MNILKFVLILSLKFVLVFMGIIMIYVTLAVVFTWIPSNAFYQPQEKGIELFIKSNGVHTDIVLPVRNDVFDWRTKLDTTTYKKESNPLKYVSIGWGDKGFYLETPSWAELKFSTAFKAMFMFPPTALHVTYKTEVPVPGEKLKRIFVSKEQYLALIEFVNASFQSDKNGKFLLINANHYSGANDNFYEANGRYSLFRTCNGWANLALKNMGVKTALWAPFDKCILYHFD